jgi:CheY-like chemotaxis protein
MVVDDDDDVRRMARLTIEVDLEARVSEASSAADAVARCCAEHVDLIVLDMNMPEMCGLDLLEILNSLSDRPTIVAWSSNDQALRRAREMGAEVSIVKTDVAGLSESVRSCLRKAGDAPM